MGDQQPNPPGLGSNDTRLSLQYIHTHTLANTADHLDI